MSPWTLLAAYAAVTLTTSLLAFTAYGVDKYKAGRGRWRISERTLHLMALCGGWPGAWLGQRTFRHKTQKLSFRLVFWTIVLLHLSAVGVVVYLLIANA